MDILNLDNVLAKRSSIAPLLLAVCALSLPSIGVLHAAPVESADDGASESASQPEGTDIWLLKLEKDGEALRATEPRNITNRPGYDNQPYFTPAGDLMYVQMENERTDLWIWESSTQEARNFTNTSDQGEFSPTPIPGGDGGVSYIRSPTDTSGRLWRIPQAGAEPENLFPDIGPVGYHAWFDADHVALWRLQEPSLLQHVELATGKAETFATGVGRTPQSVPGRRAVSFTREVNGKREIELFDLDTARTEALATLPDDGEFHAWTPDGVLLGSAGSQVYAWIGGGWQEVLDLSAMGLIVSRLAVSPDTSHLAVVAESAP